MSRGDEFLNDIVTQLVLEVGPLEDADTCLSVGTGCGEYDIIFARHFLPNLKKFIAVEKLHGRAEKEFRKFLWNRSPN